MDVIVVRGQYNTGKTIILRLLYAKLSQLDFVEDLTKHFAWDKLSSFRSITSWMISKSADNLPDYNDFSARLLINGKKIQLVSYSVNSDMFKSLLDSLDQFKPDVVVFCAKEKEIGNTAYAQLQIKLLDVSSENYLEIPVYRIKSDKIEMSKTKLADDLVNILLRISSGETLNEIGYHENNDQIFLN